MKFLLIFLSLFLIILNKVNADDVLFCNPKKLHLTLGDYYYYDEINSSEPMITICFQTDVKNNQI